MNRIKILSLILLSSLLFPLFVIPGAHGAQETYFIVTAYYSPLPDQDYYLTGNYEDEKRLNGQGIAGASGEAVFSGMLAAPKSYSFGTQIYLEGLGIGQVEDRGGAIVPAGQRGYSYDRIDVWMGYGDEGLRRALYWGKRKVAGYITSGNTNLDYTSIPAPSWATAKLTKQSSTQTSVSSVTAEESLFTQSLGKHSSGNSVAELQEILEKLGYLEEYTLGEYDEATIDGVYRLQIETEILESSSDYGAGYFGPKTRKELKILYEEYQKEQDRIKQEEIRITKLREQSSEQAAQAVEALSGVSFGEVSPRVRELQKLLGELGYFDYKDTAIYGEITKQSIIAFQKDAGLIESELSVGAGVFGPKTREQSIARLEEKIFQTLIRSESES